MLRSSRLLALPMIAAGFLLVCDTNEAQAQIRVQIGGFGLNGRSVYRGNVYRGGHHYSSNRVYGHSTRRLSYGTQRYGHNCGHYGGHYGWYHDTTHLDYHAPQIYRHGNHWDYQPGHYDIHRTGHWHH